MSHRLNSFYSVTLPLLLFKARNLILNFTVGYGSVRNRYGIVSCWLCTRTQSLFTFIIVSLPRQVVVRQGLLWCRITLYRLPMPGLRLTNER